MDDDGIFFLSSTFGRCLAATGLEGSYLGLLQHGELLHQRRSRGSKIGAVAASQKAGAPQAFNFPFFFLFELLQPKCQGTVLELTR